MFSAPQSKGILVPVNQIFQAAVGDRNAFRLSRRTGCVDDVCQMIGIESQAERVEITVWLAGPGGSRQAEIQYCQSGLEFRQARAQMGLRKQRSEERRVGKEC